MLLSIVIPSRNEASSLKRTLTGLYQALSEARIDHELIVVDDNSMDATAVVVESLQKMIPSIVLVKNTGRVGFGLAVRCGLDVFKGDAVAIVMADGSDNPEDVVHFMREFETGKHDCVFGSRFHWESIVEGYPRHKWILNRIVNTFIRFLFGLKYNDVTNAFKLYGAHVIEGLRPLISPHFNLTVELPLKAIVRGYSYAVLPNDWHGRKDGRSKLKIKEMGSRYLFIILYCFIEKWLSSGDYKRTDLAHSTEVISKRRKSA